MVSGDFARMETYRAHQHTRRRRLKCVGESPTRRSTDCPIVSTPCRRQDVKAEWCCPQDVVRRHKAGTLTADTHILDWLQLIRAEYVEIPGLRLTKAEVQRLWGLDEVTTDALLSALEDVKFLRRTHRDAYVRADIG